MVYRLGGVSGYGLWEMGCGLWVAGYGLREMGNGLWVVGYGLWVMGYGLGVMSYESPDNFQAITHNS